MVELDVSGVLKPGVYMLCLHGRAQYVGKAKCLLVAIAAHRSAMYSPRLPEWFPIHRIPFDSVFITPCASDRQRAVMDDLISYHQPRHNKESPAYRIVPPPTESITITRRL